MIITLANLHEASAQQVFDQVSLHLLTQNQKSNVKEFGNKCLYRGPNDLKCAAGCLISDDEFKNLIKQHSEELNNYSWEQMIAKDIVKTKKHHELIEKLQRIHDHEKPDQWKLSLQNLAIRYNFNINVITNFKN